MVSSVTSRFGAKRSRALAACRKRSIASGAFKDEIVPVTVKGRKGEVVVDADEEPAKISLDKIPTLRPAFTKDGAITAANASSISDGAAALVMTRESTAKTLGLPPAVVKSYFEHRSPAPIRSLQAIDIANQQRTADLFCHVCNAMHESFVRAEEKARALGWKDGAPAPLDLVEGD